MSIPVLSSQALLDDINNNVTTGSMPCTDDRCYLQIKGVFPVFSL